MKHPEHIEHFFFYRARELKVKRNPREACVTLYIIWTLISGMFDVSDAPSTAGGQTQSREFLSKAAKLFRTEVFHGFPTSEFDMAEHIPQTWVACSACKSISVGKGLSDTPYYQPMLLGEGSAG